MNFPIEEWVALGLNNQTKRNHARFVEGVFLQIEIIKPGIKHYPPYMIQARFFDLHERKHIWAILGTFDDLLTAERTLQKIKLIQP